MSRSYTITLDIDDDTTPLHRAVMADQLAFALDDIKRELRNWRKYGPVPTIEHIEQVYHDILTERGIDLDALIS